MNDAAHPDSAAASGSGSAPALPCPSPPLTGDAALDAAMTELAEAQAEPLGERIGSGERFHRVLQSRLDDLGRA